ncbi:MAG: type 4a pilus biogenesis protein PilO [Patescibacteria group bacterium]
MINNVNHSDYYRRLKEFSRQPEAKISGLISLTIFTVTFFGIFAIMPTFKTIAQLNKEIQDATTINNQLAKKVFVLESAQELYSQQIDNLPLIDKILPAQISFERLTWQLSWLIKEKGLELVNANYDEFLIVGASETKEPGPQSMPMEITVKGSFSQIKELTAALQKFDRLITLQQATITSKKNKNDDNKIMANFKLATYWLPEKNDQ